jgi:hypothetical protein
MIKVENIYLEEQHPPSYPMQGPATTLGQSTRNSTLSAID